EDLLEPLGVVRADQPREGTLESLAGALPLEQPEDEEGLAQDRVGDLADVLEEEGELPVDLALDAVEREQLLSGADLLEVLRRERDAIHRLPGAPGLEQGEADR